MIELEISRQIFFKKGRKKTKDRVMMASLGLSILLRKAVERALLSPFYPEPLGCSVRRGGHV